MYYFRRIRRHIQRYCTMRFLCMVAACCVLVKITTGYSVNRIENVKAHERPDASVLKKNENAVDVRPVLHANTSTVQSITSTYQKITYYDNVIVHFDLKGAPPKVSYILQVLNLIRANGATGILLEWEDTFPWSGILEENRATDAYTMEEVHKILATATGLGLDVIPLVQTFGHLEWILKFEKFRKHRENDMYPQVVCLADEEGVDIVKEALKQVINIHKNYGIKFFHIGADEAFLYGSCQKDMEWLNSHTGQGKEELAALHVKKIAQYVRSLIPESRVLAWHDMIKSFPHLTITNTGLNDLIEPVVWDYSETLQQQNEMTWKLLSYSFSTVWGSSAFKGANTPASQQIDLIHYMKNNKEWLKHKRVYGSLFKSFRGLIITGWSRYDHFAVFSELLPSGIPSLVLNLQTARGGYGANEVSVLKEAEIALKCKQTITLVNLNSLQSCEFPGSNVFNLIHYDIPQLESQLEREVYMDNEVRGWLGRMNMRHNYTQLWYFTKIAFSVHSSLKNVEIMERRLREAMEAIYSENTVDEWMYEYFDPIREKIERYFNAVERLLKLRTFPKRNFRILRDFKNVNS